jgi:CRP-like cAMP-binding protein
VVDNFKHHGFLTKENSFKIANYHDLNCWKLEDFMLLAAPTEKFTKYFDGDILYMYITSKSQGSLCGETALLQGAARNASMVAMNQVKCLTIDKETFDKYLGESSKRENEKVKFFQSKFNELSKKNVQNFICMFEVNTYMKDQTIYIEGEPSSGLHLVETGTVGMFSFAQKMKTSRKGFEEEENPTFRKILADISDFGYDHVYEFYKPIQSSEIKPIPIHRGVQISSLGSHCTFGEESLVAVGNQYFYTAIALTTPTIVLKLPKAKFDDSLVIIGSFAFQQINALGQVTYLC